jgi:UDP-N-acetyl-D-glucosamine dehydrogenase
VADEINSEMPAFWVSKVQDALNDRAVALKGAKVLVLGVAYKKDIDDMRESPALEIMDLMAQKGALVSYHDPYCPEITDDGHTPAGAVGKSIPLTDAALSGADAVIIVTDHSGIDYAKVQSLAKVVVDTRAAVARAERNDRRTAAAMA